VKLSWRIYAGLVTVFVLSALLTWVLRSNGLWQGVAAAPAIYALIRALYQLARDEAAHIKHLDLQHDQQRFEIGITSHMADVAFDKHVAVCDEFVRELFLTLQCLMNDPHDYDGAKARADAIGDVIRKHALWITPELQAQLEEFESAIRHFSSKAFLAGRNPSADTRQEVFDLLFDLIDPGSAPGKPPKRELSYRKIIDHARKVLGVKELTDLRRTLLDRTRRAS
jgi:hypothetical protein